MKFEASAGDLSAALDAAALALDDKSNVAALAMVRLTADNDHVELVVDALDRRVRVNAVATTIEQGEFSGRCSALVGILGGLRPDRKVTVEAEANGGGVVVRSGRSRFAIAGLPVDMLPRSSELTDPVASFDLDANHLQRMLKVCSHAISTDEIRFYLNGVYLHAPNKVLRGVATDGHRLVWLDLPVPVGADGMPGVIIPGKIVAILIKLLKRKPASEVVSLRLSEKLIEVSLPSLSLTLTAKLIDATFPDYIRIVPRASGNTVTVDTDHLNPALARIAALFDARAKRGMRTVRLSWSNGVLHASMTSNDATDDVIDGVTITGAGRFAARISYLVDVLEAFGSKKVTFDTDGPTSPAIRVTDPDNTAAFAVVMPVRW